MRAQVFLSFHTQLRIAESTKIHAHAPFSLASSTARRNAMRCLALSCHACGAMLCHPMSCFAELSLSCTPDDNASKHKRVGQSRHECPPAFCAAAVFVLHYCLSFFIVIWTATLLERCVPGMLQQTAVPQNVRVRMYVVEPREQQITA